MVSSFLVEHDLDVAMSLLHIPLTPAESRDHKELLERLECGII